MIKQKRFSREERLKSHTLIDGLFSDGQSFGQYPLRLIYAPISEYKGSYPVQIAISVPKRKFPKAVTRNRIKRQIREAWRLNKHKLYDKLPDDQQFAFMLIYTARERVAFDQIQGAVKGIIHRFAKKWKKQRMLKHKG